MLCYAMLYYGYKEREHTQPKSPPAIEIGYRKTVTGDPHRTAANRHTHTTAALPE